MPVAGEPSSGAADVLLELVVLDDPHAARNDGPSVSAAAAAAPPPRNRRRELLDDAILDVKRGSVSWAIKVPFGLQGEWGGIEG